MEWQLQLAKSRFSELVKRAQGDEPQTITVRGKEAAVVLSAERYHELTARTDSLADFMQHSPWAETELDVSRSDDKGRSIEL